MNFQFQLADVRNTYYHSRGRYKAHEYKFPYDDEAFDFVYVASVFTHMRPAGVKNYLSEIARVTQKGGMSLITYLLLNEVSAAAIDSGTIRSNIDYKYRFQDYWAGNHKSLDESTVLNENVVRSYYSANGLKIAEPIHYGRWTGKTNGLWGQDVIVAVKE